MRRLPVLQSTDSDDALAASRPRWHWTLIGAGFTVTLWAPLAAVAAPFGVKLAALVRSRDVVPSGGPPPERDALAGLVTALPVVVAFAVAAWAAGALVGRFGGRAGQREGGLGAVLAAFGVSSLASLVGQNVPVFALLIAFVLLAAVGALLGARGVTFGRRRRPVLGSKAT